MPVKVKIIIVTAALVYGVMVLFTELEGTLLSEIGRASCRERV